MKAVLLINIGSPDSLEIKDVKKYLTQFLMDPRVIDYPYWFRFLLIRGIIIPRRAANSAEAYQQVWTKEGSPLLVYTRKLIDLLNQKDEGYDWFWAMRYSKPSIKSQIQEIIAKGYKELIVFPAYPQFADSSTTSSIDEVRKVLKDLNRKAKLDLKVSYVEDFYNNKAFIENVISGAKKSLEKHKPFDHYLFSFHGLPESHLQMIHKSCTESQCTVQIQEENAKCYKAQCYQTAKSVAEGLGIMDRYSVAFQSRLGPSKWIEPYTDIVVEDMAKDKKIKSLAVFSLSFVTDCLETLEELDIRLKESFINEGGERFFRVPCLNSEFEAASEILRTEPLKPLELHYS